MTNSKCLGFCSEALPVAEVSNPTSQPQKCSKTCLLKPLMHKVTLASRSGHCRRPTPQHFGPHKASKRRRRGHPPAGPLPPSRMLKILGFPGRRVYHRRARGVLKPRPRSRRKVPRSRRKLPRSTGKLPRSRGKLPAPRAGRGGGFS
jgi:hypothetical protein